MVFILILKVGPAGIEPAANAGLLLNSQYGLPNHYTFSVFGGRTHHGPKNVLNSGAGGIRTRARLGQHFFLGFPGQLEPIRRLYLPLPISPIPGTRCFAVMWKTNTALPLSYSPKNVLKSGGKRLVLIWHLFPEAYRHFSAACPLVLSYCIIGRHREFIFYPTRLPPRNCGQDPAYPVENTAQENTPSLQLPWSETVCSTPQPGNIRG